MSKHYSSDNECILTGGLWALIAALVVGFFSWIFVDFWPTAIVVFAVVLLAGLMLAFFMCKARTVARGGVDIRAVDLARAEMGIAAPDNAADVAEAEDNAEAEMEAAAEAEAVAKADAAKAKADAAKKSKAKKAKAKAEVKAAAHDHEGDAGEAKPELLNEARGGKADDLKKIKGVGPKLEKELHAAGVFHFDQIASWTAEEIRWADQHLVSFKGRVSRDNWVEQATELAK
ncbi:MAG: NADH:ubiquinone oxidoreductase [Rhodobacteraceae bacterium]|nr:NADH:ubiquinone oxidoreductase [Paracoccaceae bacterium]